jgi:hypothetical protein
MGLRQQQSIFARKIALLIAFAYDNGYEITFGDAWAHAADGRHRRGSFHYRRLAFDLNLFRQGNYLSSTESHRPLGEFWESIGGAWGGRFNDGNHYSWGE